MIKLAGNGEMRLDHEWSSARSMTRERSGGKRAEQAMFRTLVDHLKDGVFILDLKGRILDVNREACRRLGYPKEQLVGMRIQQIDASGLAMAPSRVKALLRGDQPPIESAHRRRDGALMPVELSTRAVRVAGKPLLLSVARDIAERKRAEQRLHEALDLNRTMIAASPVDIGAYQAGGQCVLANEALGTIVGASVKTLLKQNFRNLRPWREHGLVKLADETLRDGHTKSVQFRSVTTFGKHIYAEHHLSRFRSDGELHVLFLVRDLTEEKRLQHQLLEVSDREQTRIGLDLHDGLCQHLVSIALSADLLRQDIAQREWANASCAELKRVEKIQTELDRCITEARNLAHNLSAVDLGGEGLADALHELAGNVRRRHGIVCQINCAESVVARDEVAAMHVYRIAREAVQNAIKHAAPDRIWISMTNHGEMIELKVANDGKSIELDTERTSGMGLSLMKYRASLLGGQLRIQKAPRGGTIVTCAFPRKGSRGPSRPVSVMRAFGN